MESLIDEDRQQLLHRPQRRSNVGRSGELPAIVQAEYRAVVGASENLVQYLCLRLSPVYANRGPHNSEEPQVLLGFTQTEPSYTERRPEKTRQSTGSIDRASV